MGSPLCRQEQEWNRAGVKLSRQTMSNWILRVTEDWLRPVYDQLHQELVGSSPPFFFFRLTPLPMVLKERPDGKNAARMLRGLGGSPFLYPLEPYR